MTHWKKLTNPDYLGAYSIENGVDLVLTIASVKNEIITGSDGKKEECMVMYFKEPSKPMVLNATNAKMIQKLLKTPYIEEWVGHKIQIGTEKVKAFGDVVDALRVRKFLPKDNALKCEKCSGVISPAYGMSPAQLAEYTKKQYGAALCAKCASKAKESAVQQETTNEANG